MVLRIICLLLPRSSLEFTVARLTIPSAPPRNDLSESDSIPKIHRLSQTHPKDFQTRYETKQSAHRLKTKSPKYRCAVSSNLEIQ